MIYSYLSSLCIPKHLGLIGLSGNNFVGAMPNEVCDLRPSPLQTLVVDCDIVCAIPACCTSCVPNLLTSALEVEDTPSIPVKRESRIGFKDWLVDLGSKDSRSSGKSGKAKSGKARSGKSKARKLEAEK